MIVKLGFEDLRVHIPKESSHSVLATKLETDTISICSMRSRWRSPLDSPCVKGSVNTNPKELVQSLAD